MNHIQDMYKNEAELIRLQDWNPMESRDDGWMTMDDHG